MAKGFKHGAGGVSALNFKVVGGTSQPVNPKENTIWVNTQTEISGWVFSASEPESPVEGMVWISTGISGGVEFNALKKNGIQICPIYAKQYADGAWVGKPAKSYHDGEWNEWITYLYNKGDECTDLTGGWVATATKPSGSGSTAVTPTVKKDTNSITVSLTSGYPNYKIGYLATVKSIDLTNYSKITINVTNFSIDGGIEVSNSKGSGFTRIAHTNLSAGKNVLDVSSLSGSYYVLVGMGGHEGTASFTFDEICLG